MQRKIFVTMSSVVVVGVIAVASITYFATEKITISADQQNSVNKIALKADQPSVKIGEAIGVGVRVEASEKISTMDVYAQYDATTLSVDWVEIAPEYKDKIIQSISVSDSKIRFISKSKNFRVTGEIAKIFFIPHAVGKAEVSVFNNSKIYNIAGEDLLLVFQKAKIDIRR